MTEQLTEVELIECDHKWIGGPEWDALHCAKCPATKRVDHRRKGKTPLTADNLAAFAAGDAVTTEAGR